MLALLIDWHLRKNLKMSVGCLVSLSLIFLNLSLMIVFKKMRSSIINLDYNLKLLENLILIAVIGAKKYKAVINIQEFQEMFIEGINTVVVLLTMIQKAGKLKIFGAKFGEKKMKVIR